MQSGRAELAELRPLVFAAKHGRAHQSTRKTEIFIFLRLAFWGGACWLRMTSGHDKPEYQDDPEHPGDHRRKRMREPLATPRANANISKESADSGGRTQDWAHMCRLPDTARNRRNRPRAAAILRFFKKSYRLICESAAACGLLAAPDFQERPRVGCDGFRNGSAINELPFAAAGDEPSFAQNLEMVRDGCGGHAAHRHDLTTVHVFGCRDGFKDPEASGVGQGFRYFLNLRTVHAQSRV